MWMFDGVLLKHEVSYYYKYNIFDNCHRVDAVGYWVDKKERSFIHKDISLLPLLLRKFAHICTNGIEGIFPILNVVITFLLTCPDE